MPLKRLEAFRLFYNNTIQPELIRLERMRLQLISLMVFSALLLTGVIALEFYLNLLFVTLLLAVPLSLFIAYLFARIDQFRRTFKPRVVRLILDFIDDGLNFDIKNPLRYDYKGFIPKERFRASRIFDTPAQAYKGEDKIDGKVGEMFFELCELRVGEMSILRRNINTVFSGVFMHSIFNEPTRGEIIVWPRNRLQFLTKSIRAFTFKGGKNKDSEILHDEFRRIFITYSDEETHVAGTLTYSMQQALVNFVKEHKKELYISFLGKDIFVALSEDKDLLEPFILRSNLSFDRVREFFDDIHNLLHLVEVFDQAR